MGLRPCPGLAPHWGLLAPCSASPSPPESLRLEPAFGKWKPLVLCMGSEEGLQGPAGPAGSPPLGPGVLASTSPTINPTVSQTLVPQTDRPAGLEQETARPTHGDGFYPYHKSLAGVQRGLPLVPWSTQHAGESVLSGRSARPASFPHAGLCAAPRAPPGPAAFAAPAVQSESLATADQRQSVGGGSLFPSVPSGRAPQGSSQHSPLWAPKALPSP